MESSFLPPVFDCLSQTTKVREREREMKYDGCGYWLLRAVELMRAAESLRVAGDCFVAADFFVSK